MTERAPRRNGILTGWLGAKKAARVAEDAVCELEAFLDDLKEAERLAPDTSSSDVKLDDLIEQTTSMIEQLSRFAGNTSRNAAVLTNQQRVAGGKGTFSEQCEQMSKLLRAYMFSCRVTGMAPIVDSVWEDSLADDGYLHEVLEDVDDYLAALGV